MTDRSAPPDPGKPLPLPIASKQLIGRVARRIARDLAVTPAWKLKIVYYDVRAGEHIDDTDVAVYCAAQGEPAYERGWLHVSPYHPNWLYKEEGRSHTVILVETLVHEVLHIVLSPLTTAAGHLTTDGAVQNLLDDREHDALNLIMRSQPMREYIDALVEDYA